MDLQETRDRLILAALPHVVFDGWSIKALALAAGDLELDASIPARVLPGGSGSMVAAFVDLADRMMVSDLAEIDMSTLKVPQRIATAIRVRLARWSGDRESIRRALAVVALPSNLGLAARLTWTSCDAIWAAVGDCSHDFSWYTRRSALAAVYTATMLYWLDDGSEDMAETMAFLERRLGDVDGLNGARNRFTTMLGNLPSFGGRMGLGNFMPGRLAVPVGLRKYAR